MQMKVEEKNSVTVCSINGDIDINTSPQIKREFDKMLSDKKKSVLINFGGVNYIDSSGLATFVELLKNVRGYSGALKLSNLSQKIRSLFEITKLEKLFDIKAEENEAIEAF